MLLDVGDSILYVLDRPGEGVPIVFVHGSWDDHRSWTACVDQLAERHRVVSYDRRGHTASTAPARQGSIADDVTDLVAVLHHVGSPAVLVGHSYGATVCLLTALDHSELILGAVVHEPPLFATLKGLPQHEMLLATASAAMADAAELIEAGHLEEGARLFVEEVAFGPGCWENTFDEAHRAAMIANAHTWLDQYRDPDRLALSPARLADAERPLLITRGTASTAAATPIL